MSRLMLCACIYRFLLLFHHFLSLFRVYAYLISPFSIFSSRFRSHVTPSVTYAVTRRCYTTHTHTHFGFPDIRISVRTLQPLCYQYQCTPVITFPVTRNTAVTYAVTLSRKHIIASSGSRSRAICIIQIAECRLSVNRRLLHHQSHPRSRTKPASHLRSHSRYSIALNSFALSGTLVYGLDSSQLIILRTYCTF